MERKRIQDLSLNQVRSLRRASNEALKSEIWFESTRSGGAGGQHVNRTESAVILRWRIWDSRLFSEMEKKRIAEKLKNRINVDGDFFLRCEKFRDQASNKEEALKIFRELLDQALVIPKARKKTKPSRSSVVKRLDKKKSHSLIKKLRSGKFDDA